MRKGYSVDTIYSVDTKIHSQGANTEHRPLFSNDKQQITPVLIAVIELSLEKNQSNLTNYLIQ